MKKHLLLFFTALLAILLLPMTSASAHRPIWSEEITTVIPDLATSYAFYRELGTGDVDVYTFAGKAGQQLHAGIHIPAIHGYENYTVSAALFGPGLPEAKHGQLPPEHPENLGVRLFPSQSGEDFFEGFSQTYYWGRQTIEVSLPSDGDFYLLIWQPDGLPGKYVMDTGRAEVFGPGDIFRFPVWWVKVHLFFGHTAYLLLGAAAILGAGAFILAWKNKPKRAKPWRLSIRKQAG